RGATSVLQSLVVRSLLFLDDQRVAADCHYRGPVQCVQLPLGADWLVRQFGQPFAWG
ncbi:MAG: hypothetical protein K0S78_3269, partial [Thermomicrobiales bacterium]|nr:hypothetical protein [Thermomicrobiales bacterium]